MRQIKLRAWDGERRRTDFGVHSETGMAFTTHSNGEVVYHASWRVVQFTDLYDMNGEEIWEGDVVRNNHGPIVYTFPVEFRWGVFGNNVSRFQQDPLHELGNRDHLEVIGNIYENPELLKV